MDPLYALAVQRFGIRPEVTGQAANMGLDAVGTGRLASKTRARCTRARMAPLPRGLHAQ